MNKEYRQTFKDVIEFFIKCFVHLMKWFYLFLSVVIGGLTIGYAVIAIVRNVDLANTIAAKLTSFITYYSETEALSLIQNFGMGNVVVASVAYGFAYSLTYGLIYYIIDKYLTIFDNFKVKNIFSKDIYAEVKRCVYISLICVISNPLIITVAAFSTKCLALDEMDFSGIFFLIFTYCMYVLFNKGYEVQKQNKEYAKDIDSLLEKETDKKVKKIKETKKTTK